MNINWRDSNTLYRFLLYITAITALGLVFYGLGDIALMSFNEARRAVPAREMYASGDWLLPHLNGQLYITKPPFLYWLQTLIALISNNVNEWTVRLPSAIAALAVMFTTYRFSLKNFGKWPALFAVQILLANVTFAMFGRRAEIEMLLTCLCVGAVLSALHYVFAQDQADTEGNTLKKPPQKRWIYLSYLLLALAMLTKGPLVLLLVTLPLIIFAISQKSTAAWQVIKSPIGWLIFIVIGLSWYLAVSLQLGFDIWHKIAAQDLANKMTGEDAKPLWSYLTWQIVDFFPFILLIFLSRKYQYLFQKNTKAIAVLIFAAVPFIIFSLFSNKHAKYLLPIYPLIAICLGILMYELFQRSNLFIQRMLIGLGVLLPLSYFIFYAAFEPKIFAYRVASLPSIKVWLSSQAAPLAYYKKIDERLFFYSPSIIKIVDDKTLNTLQRTNTLLLVENHNEAAIKVIAECHLHSFKPYLKDDKSLEVYGFGKACITNIKSKDV